MARQDRIYTIDEANAMVPEMRALLLQMAFDQARLDRAHAEMHRRLEGDGDPATLRAADQLEAEMAEIADGIRALQAHMAGMGIQIRDLEMGLVDLPGERDGNRVWLCWRLADPTVAFWHGTDEGYARRKPW